MKLMRPWSLRGLSLEIGDAFRGSVVRQDRINEPSTWLAMINSICRRVSQSRAGDSRVEASIRHHMDMVLHDWGACQAARKAG